MGIEMKIVLGGILLGLASGVMLLVRGRILGCSGMIFRSTGLSHENIDVDSVLFVLGLFLSGLIYNFTSNITNPTILFNLNLYLLFIGGLFVGAGTYIGNGCTSGHGLCGMALMRKRSIVAVAIFFPTAIIVAWLIH